MSTQLQEHLDRIFRDLITMSSLVETATRKAVRALTQRDIGQVEEIVAGDKAIDGLENSIDRACAQVLALQQPVARDLRLILTAMMVNNELERMGDHAKNIARRARQLASEPALPVHDQVEEVCELVLGMLGRSLDALVDRDSGLAKQVRSDDDAVDKGCDRIEADLVELMQHRSALVPAAVETLHVVKDLERIADLATNIAKDAIYYVEGALARHGGRYATDIIGKR